jgi:hypothetical protein
MIEDVIKRFIEYGPEKFRESLDLYDRYLYDLSDPI